MKGVVLFFAVVVVVGSVLGLVYWESLFASSDTLNVEGPSSGYLPYYGGEEETKIFLVSTGNAGYGLCNGEDGGGQMEASGFKVNVTVRNDYSKDPVWSDEDYPSDMYNKYVKLTIHLYDQQGSVDAVDITHPLNSLHGGHVFKIEPGETQSLELCWATESKDIERYEIYAAYVGPLPEP